MANADPDDLAALVELLDLVADIWNPDRPIHVGDFEWDVGDLLDGLDIASENSPPELPEDVYRSASILSWLHGLVGFDALIRFLGLYGANCATGWAGTSWWPRIVAGFVAHDASAGRHLLEEHAEALTWNPETVSGPVAWRRVELHWETNIGAAARDELRSGRFRDVGRDPMSVSPLPFWVHFW